MTTQTNFDITTVSQLTLSQLADTTSITTVGKLVVGETRYGGGYAVFKSDMDYNLETINDGCTVYYDDMTDLLFAQLFRYLPKSGSIDVDGQAQYEQLNAWLNGRLESLTNTYHRVNVAPMGHASTKYSWGYETLTVANKHIDTVSLSLAPKFQQAWAYINRKTAGWTKTRPVFLSLASLPDFFLALENATRYDFSDVGDYELLTLTDRDGCEAEWALPVPYPSWYELFAELSHWANSDMAHILALITKGKSLLD